MNTKEAVASIIRQKGACVNVECDVCPLYDSSMSDAGKACLGRYTPFGWLDKESLSGFPYEESSYAKKGNEVRTQRLDAIMLLYTKVELVEILL
jgi:hypothetical protein